MNWDVLRLLYIHELRMLVRARRTVVMAIVIPAVIMPLMLFASKFVNDQQKRAQAETVYQYAVTGEVAGRIRDLISRAKAEIADTNSDATETLRQFKLAEISVADPRRSLENREIHFFVQTLAGQEADALPVPDVESESTTPSTATQPKRLRGVPLVRVIYRGNNDASSSASNRMVALLRFAQRLDSQALLVERGFQGDPKNLLSVESTSVATAAQVTGSGIGRFLTVFLVMLMLTGGSIAAIDIIAGEKERGTLETLLTTAAGRNEIVAAKHLAICSVALISTLLQALNFLLYVKLELVALPANFVLDIPMSMVLTLVLLFIPLAATIAAVLLMISAYAKTYKEAQMYFFPVYMLSLVPALAAVLPTLSLRSAIAFVPLANVSVAVRDIMVNRPDVPMIAVTFLVMCYTATLLRRKSARMLTQENIIVPSQSEPEVFLGGYALFQKRVLRWFAVGWAIIFAAAANIPQLSTFRAQLLFNEFLVFGGGTVLILLVYRLNLREALSLRPVKWPVWIAILLAAPAGNVMGVAFFKLLNYVVPVPEAALEQMAALMPKNIPTWQLYVYLGVIPGIIEELAFRGVLLHGLKKKFRPWLLPIVVGIIFGLFHFSLFRIGPTAFLGVLLTIIAMLTGSVFPGIVLHGLNNSFAVWSGDHGWNLTALESWHYVAATMIVALAMWIIYRNRSEGGVFR